MTLAVAGGCAPTRKIRVARIIARLNIGGPAIHTVLATAGLDPTRFETMLVTGVPGEREGDMRYFAEERGVHPVELPSLGREIQAWDDLRALTELVGLLRRERPDIVHTHTAKAGTLGRMAAILAGVPIRVHTFHGHVFDGYFAPWKTRFFLEVERRLARSTTRILTLNEDQRRDLCDHYRVALPERTSVVPLGLDLERLASRELPKGHLLAELGIKSDERLVGIVGRLVPIKNHELFLSAAAELLGAHPDLRFVVVGGGEREVVLKAEAERLGLAGRTHFLGWRRDLDRIYADLDAVVLTSKNEGTPVALIEAMTAGVPVVATAVGGTSDLLRQGKRGELVPFPCDAASVARGIERTLRPEAKIRAEGQRHEILQEFGAERLCRDLEALYTSLLEERR